MIFVVLGILKVMSGVETKSPGYYTRGVREKTSDRKGFDTACVLAFCLEKVCASCTSCINFCKTALTQSQGSHCFPWRWAELCFGQSGMLTAIPFCCLLYRVQKSCDKTVCRLRLLTQNGLGYLDFPMFECFFECFCFVVLVHFCPSENYMITFTLYNGCIETRWSPRTRMPTRMLTETILICQISSKLACETPWVRTLRWHSCRTPLLDTIAQSSGETLLLDTLTDTLVRHSYLTLL